MKQVGIYEAKSKLSQLVDDAARGEAVVITRHGRPVARLVPVDVPRPAIAETIEAIRDFRKGRRLDGVSIKELINEGRKH